MTKTLHPALTLYDSTADRLTAEAARRGISLDELIAELLTIAAGSFETAPAQTGGQTAGAGSAPPAYYTVAEAAQILRLKPRTVSDYCRDGRISATKAGRAWRITPQDLQRYIDA